MRRAALLLALLFAAPASAQLTERELAAATARPAPGTRLPATVRLVDTAGRSTTLGEAAAGRPLVLLFADFTCRHLCGPGLMLTAGALHDSGLTAGHDYRLAVIGIDPKDGPGAARAFAEPLRALPDVAGATTLLRGDAAQIAAATAALGYGHRYDPAADQFAHDASVYVFAADGRLAALLPEMALAPAMLRGAIDGAGGPTLGLAARAIHLCYGFAALTGRFDRPVVAGLQLMTVLAALVAGASLVRRRARARG